MRRQQHCRNIAHCSGMIELLGGQHPRVATGLLLSCWLFLLGGVLASSAAAQSPGLVLSSYWLPKLEEGGNSSYTVNLATRPTGEVTVSITTIRGLGQPLQFPASEPIVTLDKNTLTFTTTNWNMPQTIKVSIPEADYAKTNSWVIQEHTASGEDYAAETANLEGNTN